MHAFLIIADTFEDQIASILKAHDAKRLDASVQAVEDARNLIKQTNLHINDKTAIVLSDFGSSTPETQNALLKLIEEPQENLLFIMTSASLEGILPTILSRVEIININQSKIYTDEEKNFFDFSVGEKLVRTSKIKLREDAIAFVESLMRSAHGMLLEGKLRAKNVAAIAQIYQNLKKNGNIQLQLTNLVTQLS